MHSRSPAARGSRSRATPAPLAPLAVLAALATLAAAPACGGEPGHDPALRSGFTATRYPLVLTPGFLGFDTLLDAIDYWNGIPEALAADGAEVFVTQVSQVNSSVVRGEQVIRQLEEVLAITGAEKVNLIGHSQGTLDARYVLGVRPELLASVTSIAGPHVVPEFDAVTPSRISDAGFALLTALGNLMRALEGGRDPNDPAAASEFLIGGGLAEFNAAFPAGLPEEWCGEGAASHRGVALYSWSGIGQGTVPNDPLDWLFQNTGPFFDGPSDGLVPRCSSHFGRVIRDDYVHNHLDEINWTFGLVPEYETHPVAVFRNHANRLRNHGL